MYPPSGADRGGAGWLVAANDVWVSGIYADEAAARRAAEFSDAQLARLRHIWERDGEDRPATLDDLATLGEPDAD